MIGEQNTPNQVTQEQKKKQDATIEELLNVDVTKTEVSKKIFNSTNYLKHFDVHLYYKQKSIKLIQNIVQEHVYNHNITYFKLL